MQISSIYIVLSFNKNNKNHNKLAINLVIYREFKTEEKDKSNIAIKV